ncbi:MAG: adenosine kinase, adenosine kinase [Candidatus Peregrinibacteria bacterium GW2011_GWE2_39_6]|nr:MAG: adenosine kinase, adenosine kinase [Candidatus Peregrinibacteria bacterium GW2011_GWF2_39_17]KKR26800.1 MAG: adenosine kinase, adenosine kinase [Candidatus Peregrinibacteria bacterium GW2011_GWE2_39_6]HCW32871.1 carbohydrate kinase family protein [Candidatus Peregrinibacteria bacterium]
MPKIIVTGSIAYDYLLKYSTPFEDVLLPNKLNSLSVCFVVDHKERHFGGTAGNIAYNFYLLKEKPILIADVGADFQEYENRIRTWQIPTNFIRVHQNIETPLAIITTDINGHQITQFYPGALLKKPQTNLAQIFKKTNLILIAPEPKKRMLYYIKTAKKAKTNYFFDPGQNIPTFTKAELLEAIHDSTGIFVNDYEYEILKLKTKLSAIEILKYTQNLIITLGSKGSLIYSKNYKNGLKIPALSSSKPQDPTGCGDAYRAGFLKGYLDNKPLEICGKMGALLGTYVLEKNGTQTHHFTPDNFKKKYHRAFKADL